MGVSHEPLDQAIFESLEQGKALLKHQLDQFLLLLQNNNALEKLTALFQAHPSYFLQSIASTIDADRSATKDETLRRTVAQISRLFLPEAATKAFSICGEKLKQTQADSPSSMVFYLALYVNQCVKHPETDISTMVPTLVSLLALKSLQVREMAIFALLSQIRHLPATETQITTFLHNLLERESPELSARSFSVLSTSLEAFFPVLPDAMTSIYVSEPCKQAFLYQGLLLNPEKDTNDYTTAEQLLHVLSLSCIKETARKFNTENYLQLLIAGTRLDSSPTIRALSLLCIVKLWNFSAIEKQISMDSVFSQTLSFFVEADPKSDECKALLEALAYLSLGTATKAALRSNELALEQLVLILETSLDPLVIYGCLLVLLSLCKIHAPGQDKDTNTLNYLKSISSDKPGGSENDEAAILAFNASLVTSHKVVSTMAALKHAKSNSVALMIEILHSISVKQGLPVQREIVAQGGLNLVIKYLIDHSKISKTKNSAVTTADVEDERSVEVRICGLCSLATFCRSVNPSLAFSKYDVKTCVPFLVELLGPEPVAQPNAPFSAVSVLGPGDKLCSLLALTNLSSLPDNDLHASIISRAFEQHLKSLMIDSTLFAVQKATWELINNLIVSPLMLAKFFNPESADSRKNLDLLVKMLHSEDESLQEVIASLIANATLEFDLVCESLLSQEQIFDNLRKIVASIFTEQTHNTGLILRVVTFLERLTAVAYASKSSALAALRNDTALKTGIKAVVTTTKNPEIMSSIHEIVTLAELKFGAM